MVQDEEQWVIVHDRRVTVFVAMAAFTAFLAAMALLVLPSAALGA